MNNQLIEKVIKSNSEVCPPLIYQNPLLDRTVASALTKSFVKILKVSGQNININSTLRFSVLENIRRLCQVESENHLTVEENFTELLTETYQKSITDSICSDSDAVDRSLDAFLLKRLKCVDMDSSKRQENPEIIQALNNLDNGVHLHSLSQEVIYWDVQNQRSFNVLKNMWNINNVRDTTDSEASLDIISVKLKSEIESIVLQICLKVLQNKETDLDVMFTSDSSLLNLVKNCSVSPECFKICCSILNYIFVNKYFDQRIQTLISTFVNYIKLHSPFVSISTLYPSHLCNLVLLLDIDLKNFPELIKHQYIELTRKQLRAIHKESENDLILLLAHFPGWFDVYFDQTK